MIDDIIFVFFKKFANFSLTSVLTLAIFKKQVFETSYTYLLKI